MKEAADYILNNFKIRSLALWGKSLGAVAGMLYLGKTIDVKAIIMDSPYRNAKNYI